MTEVFFQYEYDNGVVHLANAPTRLVEGSDEQSQMSGKLDISHGANSFDERCLRALGIAFPDAAAGPRSVTQKWCLLKYCHDHLTRLLYSM